MAERELGDDHKVYDFPNKRYLHVFLAGGDLDEIKAMNPDLEDFAKCGCVASH